jgi:hypothetical protein
MGLKNEMEEKMKIKMIRVFMLLLLITVTVTSVTFARGNSESEKSQIIARFRSIEKEMRDYYGKGKFNIVIDLYERNLSNFDKRMVLRSIDIQVRLDIYQWVALSHFKLGQHEEVKLFLKKLRSRVAFSIFSKFFTTKNRLNEVFRHIWKEMETLYENGKLMDVIDLYKKYSGKDAGGKTLEENKIFKRAGSDIRADIYRLVALSYDDLDDIRMRDFYIKKIVDIKGPLESAIYRPSWRAIFQKEYILLPRSQVGYKIGGIYSTPRLDNGTMETGHSFEADSKNFWGGQFSLVIENGLSKNHSQCVELAVGILNVGYEDAKSGDTYRNQLSFLDLRYLFKYRFVKKSPKLTPYLQIGPFIRSVLSARSTLNSIVEQSLRLDDTRFDYGFLVAAGFGVGNIMGLAKFRLEFEVNYQHGFKNIFFDDPFFNGMKLRNWSLCVKVLMVSSSKAYKR